ncbi:hypothetical protein FOZ63_002652 [Perkinsus olseni]|uniref:GOLD domain-containing protein n=2 Tax=Perkinsus olseni TaxID=32597 RepID=A0A7J6UEU0_PEROL|nr:hypothetical protein FOZ63_002652 [Perkinsus olseni]
MRLLGDMKNSKLMRCSSHGFRVSDSVVLRAGSSTNRNLPSGSKFTLIRYRLLVTNKHWSDSQEVTLGVMVGGSKTLKTEHITDVQEQIDVLDTILRDTQAESTYLWIRQKNHLGVVQSMHSRVLWFFLFDFVALTVAAWFQVYYVKSLLMDRRFI